MTDERREDDEQDQGLPGSAPDERTPNLDDDALPDTTDENDVPVDNPSG